MDPHRRPVAPAARVHHHAVRRLRDALRSQILHGDFPGGLLPSENELMAGHAATRGTVREALSLLRQEGLIDRTQGVGTYAIRSTILAQLNEMHGAIGEDSLLDRSSRPQVLDRSVVPATPPVARRLGVEPGTPCLRYEYVARISDEPMGVATNYALFPEAERLLGAPFATHWYQLMAAAEIEPGASEFAIGCVVADTTTADLLDVPEGGPLLLLEQLIRDPGGRAWDLAFCYIRMDRFMLVSRLSLGRVAT